MQLKFVLNQKDVCLESPADRRVVDLLREDIQGTGTKEGCGTGECGACTILVDGRSRLACLMIAAQLEGCSVTTVEGLSGTMEGDALRNAFVTEGAVQCGYCTPGMEMVALELLMSKQEADRNRIREAISGNLCRCTGYTKIVDAIERAVKEVRFLRERP